MEVYKFVLSEKTTIYLREPTQGDVEKSAQIAGKKAGNENQAYLSVLIQKEMLKSLLVQINDKKLSLQDKEQLDKMLTFREHANANKAVMMIVGDDQGNVLTPEFTTIGE